MNLTSNQCCPVAAVTPLRSGSVDVLPLALRYDAFCNERLDSYPMSAPWVRGGPKLGTSSGKLPRDWLRSEQVRVTFRPGEFKDLEELAHHWGVPLGTAVWAIVHERMASWRKWKVELGSHGMAINAALTVLQREVARPE